MKQKILNLHPTQLAVGFQQVNLKARKMEKKTNNELKEYVQTHEVPVIVGPHNKYYIIDHHHLCCAAYKILLNEVYIKIVENWSEDTDFWNKMHEKKYIWLYDSNGLEISISMS